jgi:hypothetical protein
MKPVIAFIITMLALQGFLYLLVAFWSWNMAWPLVLGNLEVADRVFMSFWWAVATFLFCIPASVAADVVKGSQ